MCIRDSSNSGAGTVTISGNLNVTGTTTTVSSANLEVTDKNILIAKGSTSDANSDGAGITIDSATDITWNFVDAKDAWVSSIGVEATTFLKGPYGQFTGSGTPATGMGVEVNAPDANTGQIISYDRSNTAYKDLRIKGSSVGVYTGTSNVLVGTFNSTGLTLEKNLVINGGAAGDNALLVTGNYSGGNPTVDIQTWQRIGGAVQAKMIYKDASTDMHFGTDTAHTFSIMTGGSDRIKIASNGAATSIGGAMAFNAMLTVQGDVSGSLLSLKAAEDTNRFNVSGMDGNDVEVNLYDKDGTQRGILVGGATEFAIKAPNNASPLTFYTHNGTSIGERLRITNTGQVKIGNNPTIDANTNIHVQEENGECGVVIDGNTGGAGAYLLLKNRSTSSNPRTYISGIDAGGQGIAQIDFWNLDNDNNEGAISLSTRPSGGSMTQRLYIDSSGNATFTGTGGNVHTFTSDSYHVLDIVADSNNDEGNSDNIIRFRHGSGGSLSERAEIRYDESDGWLELSAGDNQNHLVIKSDGFVGVGVSPTAKLHVSSAYNQVGLKVAGGAHNGYSSPLQVLAANGDMRLEVSGDNGVQFTRGPVGGAEHVSNTPDMWQKIGIWKGAFVDGAARCKITVMGTDTHDSNGNVAGETIIYLAFGANHVLKGYFYSTTGQYPGIAGVAWNYDNNDSSNKKVEVWVKYDSAYGMTSCYADCSTGLFEGSNINSGLTSVPAGATEIESYFTIRTATGGSSHERLRINPDGTVKVAQDLLMDKASDPKIYSGANVGLNIDGGSLYLNRNVQSSIELAWGGGPVNMTNTADADVQLNIYKQSGADTNQAILRIGYDSNNNYSISRVRNQSKIVCDSNQGGAYVYHKTEGKDVAILTPTQVFATAKHASKVTAYSGINTAHWGDEAVKKFYASYYAGASAATYHVARMISQTDWGFDNIEIKVAKYQYNPTSDDLNTKQFTTYYGSHQSRISNYNQQSSGSGTGNWNVLNWRQDFGPGGAHQIHNQNNGGYYRDCYGSDLYVDCGVYTGMRLEFTVWASNGTYDCGHSATAQDFYPAAFGGQASQTDADNWNGPRGIWFNSGPNGTGQGTNTGLFNWSTGSVYGEVQM